MVMICEVFQNAQAAFESAGLHEVIPELGKCKLSKEGGIWVVTYWKGVN